MRAPFSSNIGSNSTQYKIDFKKMRKGSSHYSELGQLQSDSIIIWTNAQIPKFWGCKEAGELQENPQAYYNLKSLNSWEQWGNIVIAGNLYLEMQDLLNALASESGWIGMRIIAHSWLSVIKFLLLPMSSSSTLTRSFIRFWILMIESWRVLKQKLSG